jgi:hypothetical protein
MAFLGGQPSDFDGNGEFVSGILPTLTHDKLVGAVVSNEAGSFYVEQSMDKENWDVVNHTARCFLANTTGDETYINDNQPSAVTADNGSAFAEDLILPWVRIRFVTISEDDPTTFRLHARTSDASVKY